MHVFVVWRWVRGESLALLFSIHSLFFPSFSSHLKIVLFLHAISYRCLLVFVVISVKDVALSVVVVVIHPLLQIFNLLTILLFIASVVSSYLLFLLLLIDSGLTSDRD